MGYASEGLSTDGSATIAMTAREGANVCFNTNDHRIDIFGATLNVNDTRFGMIYRNELGAELTVYFDQL